MENWSPQTPIGKNTVCGMLPLFDLNLPNSPVKSKTLLVTVNGLLKRFDRIDVTDPGIYGVFLIRIRGWGYWNVPFF